MLDDSILAEGTSKCHCVVSFSSDSARLFSIYIRPHILCIYIHSQQSVVVVVVVVVDRGAGRDEIKNGGWDQTGGGMGPGWRTGLCCG